MPSAASSSTAAAQAEGQRRSGRQRIDLSQAEEGFDRHELEKALRESLNEANKSGIVVSTTTSPTTKNNAVKTASGGVKRKMGKKEAKREKAKLAKKAVPEKKAKIEKPSATASTTEKPSTSPPKPAVDDSKGKKTVGRPKKADEPKKENAEEKPKPAEATSSEVKATVPASETPAAEPAAASSSASNGKPVSKVPKKVEGKKKIVVKKPKNEPKPKVEADKKMKLPRTSEFITLLACAKKVLGDH